MQRVTVLCEQIYGEECANAMAEHSSEDMGMEIWRFAIEGAAMAAGFSKNMLNQMIIDWAGEILESTNKEDVTNGPL